MQQLVTKPALARAQHSGRAERIARRVVGTVRLEGTQVHNIPLGRYIISARHVPTADKTPHPLEVRRRDAGAYAETLTAFWEVAADGRPQVMELEVRPRPSAN